MSDFLTDSSTSLVRRARDRRYRIQDSSSGGVYYSLVWYDKFHITNFNFIGAAILYVATCMLLVDFTLTSPILSHALSAVPEMTVTHQRWDMTTEREIFVLLWAATDDFSRFDAALDTDPTVTDRVLLDEIDGQRLYRLRLSEEGRAVSVYPVVVECRAICHEIRGTHSGWDCQLSFPDRDALDVFHTFCRAHDLGFDLRSLHEEHARFEHELYGLTAKQYEALSLAFEHGYFAVPRETTLSALAERLDISRQAFSRRLMRAERTVFATVMRRVQ